jgi:hypothetical protein
LFTESELAVSHRRLSTRNVLDMSNLTPRIIENMRWMAGFMVLARVTSGRAHEAMHLPASRADLRRVAEPFRIVWMGLPGGMAGCGETACKLTGNRQCGAALPALILAQPGEGVVFSNASE